MRILIGQMTPMLASIVGAAVASAPDMALAGRCEAGQDLADQIRDTRVDAVVVQSDRPEAAAEVWPILRQFPALKVVAIGADSREGFLHELRPRVTHLGDMSAASLADALRGAAARLH